MPFCIQCGTQLGPNAQFCPNCGNRIQSATASYPAPGYDPTLPVVAPIPQQTPSYPVPPYRPPPYISENPPNAEQVLSVIYPARKQKSLGRSDSYSIVLTNFNMILAQVTKDLLNRAIEDARANAKAQGKGFFGQWADQLKGDFAYGQKYLSMQPAQIIVETLDNSVISNNTITRLDLGTPLRNTQNQTISREFNLKIHSTTGTTDLMIPETNNNVNALKQVFGDRVKTPFGYFAGGYSRIGI